MFVRNGVALGSVQVDPSASDPHKRRAKAEAVQAPVEDDAPTVDVQPEPPAAEVDVEPVPEPPAAEPKKAPAKKAAPAFKSALDNPKG